MTLTEKLIEIFREQGLPFEWLKDKPDPNFIFECNGSCGTDKAAYRKGERCIGCPKEYKKQQRELKKSKKIT